jgi:hypothetical protein
MKEEKFKKIIRAIKRIDELHELISKQPKEKLEKPIFAGHWRFFKVREDVLRSSIGEQIKKVVDATNTWVLGKKNDERSFNCSYEEYSPWTFKSYNVQGQGLRPLYSRTGFEELGFPDFFKRKWFLEQKLIRSFGSKNVTHYKYYPNIKKHMIEFAYKPAYIKEVFTKNGSYESELAKLYQFMDQENAWKLVYGRNLDDWALSLNKKKNLDKISKKEIQDEIENF